MLRTHDEDTDDMDPTANPPPITGILDLDAMVRNARLVYIVRKDLPAFHRDEPDSPPARLRREYTAVTNQVMTVLSNLVRERMPDTVVSLNNIRTAPAGSIAFGSMKLFDSTDETAHAVFRRYYDDLYDADKPRLLFMFDDKYDDGIARRAGVVMDMRIHDGDLNQIQLLDLTHRSGRRQLINLSTGEVTRMRSLRTVAVMTNSLGFVRVRTSSTDRVWKLSKMDLLEMHGRQLTIHIGALKVLIQDPVEACLVYSKLNYILRS
jgi:hypothetical protein